jgi:hypothetical protein
MLYPLEQARKNPVNTGPRRALAFYFRRIVRVMKGIVNGFDVA